MFRNTHHIVLALLVIIGTASCSPHSDPAPATQGPPYFPYVRTIIQNNCVGCHSPGGAGMPVLLHTDSLIVQYAASIKAAVHDPVSPTNKRMPEGGTLSATDINTIVNWYNAGGVSTVSGINK